MVVANLLSNALKFLGRLPGKTCPDLRARMRVTECEIVVEDSGLGIPAAEIPRVFEPFYWGSATAAPGTGIGLATVEAGIVIAHGGRVTIEVRAARRNSVSTCFFLSPSPLSGHVIGVHH